MAITVRRFMAAALAAATATAALAAPVPVPRPDPDAIVLPAEVPSPIPFETADVAAARLAVSALDLNDLEGALAAVETRSRIVRDTVLWLAIRRQVSGVTIGMIEDFTTRNPHWPSASIMRRRGELALLRTSPSPEALVRAFATDTPATEDGIVALARAELALGRQADAAKVLSPWWSRERLSPDLQRRYLAEFGDVIDKAAHKARYDMLMYADRVVQARDMAARLDRTWVALADARGAVLRDARDSLRKLEAVAGEAREDPLFAYTLAERLRRDDRNAEAADTLLAVDTAKTLPHADDWWIERRIVSRGLVEDGDYRRAYKLAAAHRGGDAETVAEAHFHAGWYALRFLDNPDLARRHFEALQASVSLPLSRSRAAYWLGRTAEAGGRVTEAREHYKVAAADEATYYGQLAHVKLGRTRLDLPAAPAPSDGDIAAFRANDMAAATVLLVKAGLDREIAPLVTELARQLPSGGQVSLLADYLSRVGDHRSALQVGKLAADRNLGTEVLAFPLDAIPPSGREQTSVEIAMVYSIARQESAFDTAAISRAGAMGLLQLLPATAQETARSLGLPFSPRMLTTDASYNATLGAAHLGTLVERFGGSYVLAFAAYNAGPRRADEWISRFGDPRSDDIDPVDWIEMIPYGETRSYVQRILENLQVYRARLDGADLAIAQDLVRGRKTTEAVR